MGFRNVAAPSWTWTWNAAEEKGEEIRKEAVLDTMTISQFTINVRNPGGIELS